MADAGHADKAHAREEKLAAYIADISARLRRACAHLPDDDYSALVRDIALMRIRFDALEDRPGGDDVIRP